MALNHTCIKQCVLHVLTFEYYRKDRYFSPRENRHNAVIILRFANKTPISVFDVTAASTSFPCGGGGFTYTRYTLIHKRAEGTGHGPASTACETKVEGGERE